MFMSYVGYLTRYFGCPRRSFSQLKNLLENLARLKNCVDVYLSFKLITLHSYIST